MKRLWPEIAVALLGLLFASFALAGDCPCVDCKCPPGVCAADCPMVGVPMDENVEWVKVCDGTSCRWVIARKKPVKPVAKPVPAVQTAEPPLAEQRTGVLGRKPVRTVVAVVWQKLRVVFHLRGRRGCASCGG